MEFKLILAFIVLSICGCSQKWSLNEYSFYDPHLRNRHLQFSTDTYFIQLKSKISDTLLFEQGKYVITNRKVTLEPQVKIQCENKRGPIVVDNEIFYPCAGIGADYHNGYYIHRDSISETDLIRFGLADRNYIISKFQDKFILKNESALEIFHQK